MVSISESRPATISEKVKRAIGAVFGMGLTFLVVSFVICFSVIGGWRLALSLLDMIGGLIG